MIHGGAILDRNATHYKRGMERFYAKRLVEIGCPILYTVHGMGSWEASDIIFVSPKCAVIGMGLRSNEEGFRQIRPILEQAGVEEFLITEMPGYWTYRKEQIGGYSGYFHLDGVFAMVAEGVAVVNTAGVGYHLLEKLHKKGVEIVEVPEKEGGRGYGAANGLVIAPGEVVVPAGSPETVSAIRKKGITVHEIDISEILKGGGGPKCITMPLIQR